MARPKCTCLEVYGEDPNCVLHGKDSGYDDCNECINDPMQRRHTHYVPAPETGESGR